jgi:lipid-binding SYLF domain-containing protein
MEVLHLRGCTMLIRRLALLSLLLLSVSTAAFATKKQDATVVKATQTLEEMMEMPDQRAPDWLLNRAYGIAIIPGVVKGGIPGIGGNGGKGVMLVRDTNGHWSNPSFVFIGGLNIGLQFGIQVSDVVLVFASRRSIEGVTGGKVTLGAGASIAAGPVGRQASGATDIGGAEIFSYSRAQGFFAGVSLDGSVMGIDNNANSAYYKRSGVYASDIFGPNPPPAPETAQKLLAAMRRFPGLNDQAPTGGPAPATRPAATLTPATPAAPSGAGLESATTHPMTEPQP